MTLLRPLLRHAAALVAIADFEIERYGTWLGLPSDRFVKIPNGADLPPDTRLIVHEGTLIVSIGRLETYKGHHRVIAALPHIIDEIPDASLWIAGGGPAEENLRAQAASLGIGERVEIRVTDRPTMAGRLRGASLAALLSDFESHPLAALEAASLDVPLVVAEDGAGLTELAQQGVARGVRLDATPAQHARAMIDEIRQPSRSAAPRIPTWDACTARLAELYRATTAAAVPRARQG
jgi:glycosyltransferase involved in cell wall biosynthesis